MAGQRYDVGALATWYVAQDDVATPATGGGPHSARLQRRTIRNDRGLSSRLRRAWGQAYPQDQPLAVPRCCEVGGAELLLPCVELTPLVQQVEWYVRMLIPVGMELYATGCLHGSRVAPFRNYQQAPAGEILTLVGTGAAANYGPLTHRAEPGIFSAGLVIWSVTTTGVAPTQVYETGLQECRCANGTFAAIAARNPTRAVLRFTDGIGVAATGIGSFHSITGIGASGIAGAVNDIAYLFPPLPTVIGCTGAVIGANVWDVTYGDVYSFLLREVPVNDFDEVDA